MFITSCIRILDVAWICAIVIAYNFENIVASRTRVETIFYGRQL